MTHTVHIAAAEFSPAVRVVGFANRFVKTDASLAPDTGDRVRGNPGCSRPAQGSAESTPTSPHLKTGAKK